MINFIIPIILLIIVLFIGFNFYRDIKRWMNTGSFVEGLTPHSSPDRKYYNGCHYVLNKELKTWTEHEEQANRQGGHLVCIHSKEENDIVKSLVPKYQQGVMPNYIFIGARRIKQCEAVGDIRNSCIESGKDGRYWSWVDGSKWDYTNWGNGEPNDCCKDATEGVGEPLGMMWESGQWNDIFHKHQSWGKGEPWNTDGTIRFPAVYKFCEKPKPNLYKKTFDGGWTWQMAKDSCEQDGNKLATKKEVIDYISTPVNGDNWVPVADNPNDWVQIGDRKSQPKAPRQDFGLLNQEIPDIGFLVGDIPDAEWHYAGGRPKWGDKKGTENQFHWKKEYYCKTDIDIDEEVRKAYRDILGREPDTGGFNYWKSQLQNGMTIAEVRTAFENSDEAKNRRNSSRSTTVPCKDTIEDCDVHYKNGGCLEANPDHMSWRTSCVKTCGYCDDPKHNPALRGTPPEIEPSMKAYEEVFNYIDKNKDGNIGIQELKAYYNEEGMKLTDSQVQMISNFIDNNRDGKISKQEFISFIEEAVQAEQTEASGWEEWNPAPIENKAMLQQPTIQNADVMVIPTDNSLFNDSIMKQVLENKNVIPSDINLALEKQNNYVRIGKNFMTGVSDVRNIELPHINDDDFESLGRIVVKIKRNVDQDSNSPQNSLYKKELMNSVNYILSGTQLKHSNVNWKAPGQAITARTTGMLGDNSNKIINNNGQSNNQPLNTKAVPLPWNATELGKF